jgi:hypothetical protein
MHEIPLQARAYNQGRKKSCQQQQDVQPVLVPRRPDVDDMGSAGRKHLAVDENFWGIVVWHCCFIWIQTQEL